MRLRTIGLIVTLILGVLVVPVAVDAQQPVKVARIGVLLPGSAPSPSAPSAALEAFLGGLRELGYVEGQNVAIEYRWAEGKLARLPDLAADLVRLKVDVIVTLGTPGVQAAKQATGTIPIVMLAVADPVKSGLVASLARPGGNVTGMSTLAGDLGGKRLELLKEILPKASRVAVLWNSANLAMVQRFREAQAAAGVLGMTVLPMEVPGDPTDFERAFAVITRDRPDALLVTVDPFTLAHRRRIVELAATHRLPAIYETKFFVDAGGLMSYGASAGEVYRRAAIYVDKILKGAKPADLPVEQPTRLELAVNLKTARALELTIPPSILIRADHVIQ
ncbi:MAG: ABC transporter substrate-binding protein [Candidatus Rokubacteria bacterium]|nr:ABC transporter substrate-binding protein [Candidatus Rokubacteria bacterium]